MPLVRKPDTQPAAATLDAPSVLERLASDNAEERWAAARAASQLPSAAAALARVLREEPDPRVREAIFTSLARIGTAESAEAILSLLRSDNAHLRTGALDALRIMPGVVSGLLAQLLNDPDVDVRILSCELARGLPGEEATGLLCGLLEREREPNVCAAAIDVLTEVGGAAALPVLAQCGERFRDAPFLAFAIKVATDRITAGSMRARG